MPVYNPRFPHTCEVKMPMAGSSFGEGTSARVLYKGVCRKEPDSRGTSAGEVVRSSYRLSIPEHVGDVVPGCTVDVTDFQGTSYDCLVVSAYTGNLGTTVYIDIPST